MLGFGDYSGISCTICEQSAPCFRQITTLTAHHSIFTVWMLFLTPIHSIKALKSILREGTYSLVSAVLLQYHKYSSLFEILLSGIQ